MLSVVPLKQIFFALFLERLLKGHFKVGLKVHLILILGETIVHQVICKIESMLNLQ